MAGSVPARIMSVNCVHAMRADITFDSAGLATGIEVGTVPAGSFILPAIVDIQTAFNAATTNVLVLGTAADDDGFVTAAGVAAGTAGVKTSLTGAQSGDKLTADTVVIVKFTQTGTAATAGSATVVLPFYPHMT